VRDVAIEHVCIGDGSGGWSTTVVSKFKSIRLAELQCTSCASSLTRANPRKYWEAESSFAAGCTRDVQRVRRTHD
jgi:hypothetical protein